MYTQKSNMEVIREKIHMIIAGGTVDGAWDSSQDTMIVAPPSKVPQFFSHHQLYDSIVFSEVCVKDSREVNEDDRKKIAKTIDQSDTNKFIITHGIYAMPETAAYLLENLKRKDAVILFVGSKTPLGWPDSDAPFNIGYALSKVQDQKPGMYVAMNGKCLTPEQAVKELSEGKFYS